MLINMKCVFQASAAEDEDEDDVDLFGEETEEEKKAAEERAAAVKASGKKKECELLIYSIHRVFIPLLSGSKSGIILYNNITDVHKRM